MLLDWVDAHPWRSDPRLHTVRGNRALWSETVPGHWPDSLGAEGSEISRGDVFDIAKSARSDGEWLPLLAATFAWGYGPSGLGYARFLKIAARDGVEESLKGAVDVLDAAGSVAAYKQLQGEVRGLGPAFFTKFLYFAQGTRPLPPGPLILDARVAASCRTLARTCLLEAGTDAQLTDELTSWQWGQTGWTAHRYGVYLDVVTGLAEHLAESSEGRWPTGRPDVVELALFDRALRKAGAWG